jgi:type I restriction-modification system DNA methylase subunit
MSGQYIKNANAIRNKEAPKDVYVTPQSLVRLHLGIFEKMSNCTVLDPCRGSGAYFNLFDEYFPNSKYEWCEIEAGIDFMDYNGTPDVIVSNPPYSILERFLEKCYELKPRYISFLLAMHAITPNRIKKANEHGYYVANYTICRVNRWFGVSVILTLSRDILENVIGFDASKHVMTEVPRSVIYPNTQPSCDLI